MNLLTKIFFVLFICTSLSASDNEDLVKELLDSSGLLNNIDNIEVKISKANDNTYVKKFESIHDTDELKENIIENIEEVLTDDDIDYLLDWYSSQTAVDISESEKENITFKEAQELITNPKKFLQDRKRVNTVLKINDILEISKFDYKITNILFLLKAKQSGTNKMTDIEKYYLSKPKELQRKIRNQSLIFLLYKFRDIQNEKLEVYLEFLNTKSAKKFISTYNKTYFNNINETLEQTME